MKPIPFASLLLTFALTLGACSSSQNNSFSQRANTTRPAQTRKPVASHLKGENMTLTGILKMRGGSRMAHLELVTDHDSYRITNPNAFGLMQQQNRSVHLKVRLVKKAIGPGFPAEVEVISVF